MTTNGGGDGGGNNGGSSEEGAKGGTAIFYNGPRNTEHLDPQRMYIGRDLNNSGRLVYRSLVALPASNDPTPVPDLATDTGQTTDGGMSWSFTVKDGVKWEDGKDITCEDFKYGASRNFATDVIIGGPSNYLFTYLDIPTGDDGLPAYKGPYTGEGQELFDKAVTCDGQTITYRIKKPWPDFPLSIAQLRYLDPYRQDLDKGDANNFVDHLQRSLQARRPRGPRAPAARSSATRTGTSRPTPSARRSPTSGSSVRVTRTRRSTSRCSPTPVTPSTA